MGNVLTQIQNDGSEKPIGYASRSLNSSELKYSVIDKEATAIMFGIKKWNQYFFCNKFTLVTDHKPLISIFGPKKGLPANAASRLQRYAVYLASYEFKIEYVNTKDNGPADELSRLPLNVQELAKSYEEVEDNFNYVGNQLQYIKENEAQLSFREVRAAAQKDPELSKVLKFVTSGWPNKFSGNY